MVLPARNTTLDDAPGLPSEQLGPKEPKPGLLLIFSVDSPRCDVLPLEDGEIELGRCEVAGVHLDDQRMSRRHARVRWLGGTWQVEDLDSRNGTWLDGVPLMGARAGADFRIVRTGWSVFLLLADVEPFRAGVSRAGGTIRGATLARTWDAIDRAARLGTTLHIAGESGTGKEHAARAFHALGPRRDGPFVPVNCAAIPAGLAERLLFGARKGAYSGAAADAEGYVQAARGGVLFLDEVAELDLGVQAKLLRTLEAKEVLPLGASRPVQVDFALVSATHKDLRAQVAAGKLRDDLFFRIARPSVRMPRLRERPEDVPWLVDAALRHAAAGARAEASAPPRAHASLIEACLLRAWPGNIRELTAEIRAAAQEAHLAGSSVVHDHHLSPSAGQLAFPGTPALVSGSATGTAAKDAARAPQPAAEERPSRQAASWPAEEEIEAALRREQGNVTRAARTLGMHRNQLRRWLARRAAGGGEDTGG
ncbi:MULTISPECIES: sigma 54-interacting transcriptional regulator [Sorangium]|uniref:sigma 54-interacting transcriptional regulator n=1 Tax=Sorangium TaxID=39643 RepID=UPI00101A8008|nr:MULTISPECIES: sigma 54-interacting transcriptional regulator [Sorangium]